MDTKTITLEMGGYAVELHPYVTRRMSREYTRTLTETANLNADGQQIITADGVNKASEYMVLAMIKRVTQAVDHEDGKVEVRDVTVDTEWLDELAEKDFNRISETVRKLFEDAREKGKK